MHHIQGNHNMIKGEFSPETIKATKKKKKKSGMKTKQNKKTLNQEFYIHQNFPSKLKVR